MTSLGSKRGIIYKNIVVEPQFDSIIFYSKYYLPNSNTKSPTILAAVKKNNKWPFISTDGKVLLPFQFDEVDVYFYDGMVKVKAGGKVGLVDINGKLVVKPQFDLIGYFNNNTACVKSNKKWGLIDKNGKIIIKPIYEDIQELPDQMCAVKLKGKWGFVNKYGKLVIQPQFNQVFSFSNGIAAVKKDKLWGFIDKSGKFIVKPTYDNITILPYTDLYILKKDKNIGLMDSKGKVIVDAINEFIEDDENLLWRIGCIKIKSSSQKYGFVLDIN